MCHTVAFPFTLKSILRQKKNYGNSNISPCKNIIFKTSSNRHWNRWRYYNSITNLKFQHKPKFHLSKILIWKWTYVPRGQNPLSYYLLHNNIRGFVRCGRRPLGVEVQWRFRWQNQFWSPFCFLCTGIIQKVTLSLGLLPLPVPSFSGIRKEGKSIL